MVFTAPAPESAPSVQASASPTPARSTPQLPWFSRSGYFIMGSSPMVSMYANGFAPGIRYDVESGFAFRRGNLRLMFGANPKLMQYFGRKRPAGGLDGVVTASWRAVYVRAGAGVMANLPSGPRGAELARVLPAVGGRNGIADDNQDGVLESAVGDKIQATIVSTTGGIQLSRRMQRGAASVRMTSWSMTRAQRGMPSLRMTSCRSRMRWRQRITPLITQ